MRGAASRDVPGAGELLSAASRGALIVGAIWSAYCTFNAGRQNKSVLLMLLFLLWVLSPYAGFVWAIRSARQHHVGILRALQANSIVVVLTSVVIYSFAGFSAPSHEKAFAFLVVPAATWLAIGTFVVAARVAGRR